MITELTEQQKEMASIYRDKWKNIGLSTELCNREEAEKCIKRAYVVGGINPPQQIIWADSPLGCLYVLSNLHRLCVGVGNRVWDILGDRAGAQVWSNVWHKIRDLIIDPVWEQIRDMIRDQIRDERSNKEWGGVWGGVWGEVWTFCYGNHYVDRVGFYNYFLEIFNLSCCLPLIPLMNISKNCGWFLPYENVCICSEKPEKITFSSGKLHCDGDAAIRYRDGFSVYALNGVRVSKEIACTPAEELDTKLLLTEKSADVRAQIANKIGIERICADLNAKKVDTFKLGENENILFDVYELLLLDIGDGNMRPYLKMLNASEKIYHIEGVHPDCKTAKEAFCWRYFFYKTDKYNIIGIA